MSDVEQFVVPKETIKSVARNNKYNQVIATYYDRLMQECVSNYLINKYDRKLAALRDCNKFWDIDRYKEHETDVFKKTYLCHDKFCNNCKKVKQKALITKYLAEIKQKSKEYNVSQIVLTVPNVTGEELAGALDDMIKAFAMLIRYLKRTNKIKGVDLDQLGYVGAIRSLEITFNQDMYHPHLHVLVVHEHKDKAKTQVNKYSYSNKQPGIIQRFFSRYEVLIQKLWKLLYDGYRESRKSNGQAKRKRITKDDIEALDVGYSCMIDAFKEDDYVELFKYITKAKTVDDFENESETGDLMTYENFKTLEFALHGVRQIQGYGCFYGVKEDVEIGELREEAKKLFEALVSEMRQKETPQSVCETPEELAKSVNKLISEKQIYTNLLKQR